MELTPHQYYSMTRAEFIIKSKGYHKKQMEKWEHTRFLGYQTISTIPSKKKLPGITKWMPLPSDEGVNISKDRIKLMLEKAKQKHNG